MQSYDPVEPPASLIQKLEKGIEFERSGGQEIADAIMVYKGITLLSQKSTFNEDIQEWRRQSADLKAWATFKIFFTELIENNRERPPPQENGDTQWRYKICMVYRHHN